MSRLTPGGHVHLEAGVCWTGVGWDTGWKHLHQLRVGEWKVARALDSWLRNVATHGLGQDNGCENDKNRDAIRDNEYSIFNCILLCAFSTHCVVFESSIMPRHTHSVTKVYTSGTTFVACTSAQIPALKDKNQTDLEGVVNGMLEDVKLVETDHLIYCVCCNATLKEGQNTKKNCRSITHHLLVLNPDEMGDIQYLLYIVAHACVGNTTCLNHGNAFVRAEITAADVLLQARKKDQICAVCIKIGSKDALMNKCGDCNNVYYCSKECQRQDWRTHKLVCGDDS
jgi:hypothetical protein